MTKPYFSSPVLLVLALLAPLEEFLDVLLVGVELYSLDAAFVIFRPDDLLQHSAFLCHFVVLQLFLQELFCVPGV